ncbi:condensation domain-containing protein, partial [Rheinheimera gaetbuli]
MPSHLQGAVVSSPLCFDATLTSLLTPLCEGKRVVLLADGDAALEALPAYLFGEQSWLFKLTPAHLDALVYSQEQGTSGGGSHVIVVGGEQWRMSSLQRWKGVLLPASVFVNEYGPTETVVGTSVLQVSTAEELAALSGQVNVPIGRPIAGSQLYVVGVSGQWQPVNSVGELYIGGEGVGQGYINLAEQTSGRFISYQGARVYKSGDLVRWLSNGQLAFIGRADEQVKVRGYRIELGEIQAQLVALPQVQHAEVIAVKETKGGEESTRLLAYLVAAGEDAFDEQELAQICRQHLSAGLPEYMVPSAFVLLASMPLTANGKLNRNALPVPKSMGQESGMANVGYVAPAKGLETLICAIWAEVLKLEQVGVEDNFFSLGGDSILSIRVVSLLKREGYPLAIKDLFTYQTVAALSRYIEGSLSKEEAQAVQATAAFGLLTPQERADLLEEEGLQDAYPLSVLQAGMVFHTQLAGFNGTYHDFNAEHIVCPWDEVLFGRALSDCISAHPILRSRYRLSGERALQLVYEADAFLQHGSALPLVVEDLRGQEDAVQQSYVSSWIEQHKRHEFDWAGGALYQVNIFRRTDDSFTFVLSFHHSVLDGWSRASLTTVLYNRYQQLLMSSDGKGDVPVALEEESIYREFISLEQAALNNVAARHHFMASLEDAPIQQLPVNGIASDDAVDYRSHSVVEFTARSAGLIGLAAELGVPVQVVLMALHIKVLSTVSGQSRVLTNVVYNGRPEIEGGERGLGLFLNSLPVVVELKAFSWRELIEQVMAQHQLN